MARILLFGRLRKYGLEWEPGGPSVLDIAIQPQDTVASVLESLGIPLAEVANVFVNGRLAESECPLAAGDRLGIFGKDMSLLYV